MLTKQRRGVLGKEPAQVMLMLRGRIAELQGAADSHDAELVWGLRNN